MNSQHTKGSLRSSLIYITLWKKSFGMVNSGCHCNLFRCQTKKLRLTLRCVQPRLTWVNKGQSKARNGFFPHWELYRLYLKHASGKPGTKFYSQCEFPPQKSECNFSFLTWKTDSGDSKDAEIFVRCFSPSTLNCQEPALFNENIQILSYPLMSLL